MQKIDRDLLFKALGFLSVALSGNGEKKNASTKAMLTESLIKDYCRENLPEAFSSKEPQSDKSHALFLDLMICSIKKQHKEGYSPDLPADQKLMDELFERLQERQRIYLTHISDHAILQVQELLHLLEQENRHILSEAQMMMISIEGDPHAFTPYSHLATAIVEKIKETGACSKSDLEQEKFSSEEISQKWNMAYALAQVELMGD